MLNTLHFGVKSEEIWKQNYVTVSLHHIEHQSHCCRNRLMKDSWHRWRVYTTRCVKHKARGAELKHKRVQISPLQGFAKPENSREFIPPENAPLSLWWGFQHQDIVPGCDFVFYRKKKERDEKLFYNISCKIVFIWRFRVFIAPLWSVVYNAHTMAVALV